MEKNNNEIPLSELLNELVHESESIRFRIVVETRTGQTIGYCWHINNFTTEKSSAQIFEIPRTMSIIAQRTEVKRLVRNFHRSLQEACAIDKTNVIRNIPFRSITVKASYII